MEYLQDAKNQFQALGQDKYEIGIINQNTGKHMSDPRTIESLEKKFDRYMQMNSHGENIYIRAPHENHHNLLMLDDLTEVGLAFISEKFAPPACIVETSSGNFQAWYKLPQTFDRETRKNMERVFVEALQSQGLTIDKKSADGGHYGRLAGFINCKPARNGFRVKLVSSLGTTLTNIKVEYLLELAQHLEITTKEAKKALSDANLYDIQNHTYANPKISKDMVWIVESLRPTNSPSETDWYIACRLAKRGYSEQDIAKAILEFSPNDINRKHDPAYYLNLTATNAINQAGPTPPTEPTSTPEPGPTQASDQVGACCSCACSPSTARRAEEGQCKRPRRGMIKGVQPRYYDREKSELAHDRERDRDLAALSHERDMTRQRM